MIEFGLTLLLCSVALAIVALIDPVRTTLGDLTAAVVQWLDGVEQHRRAQATGVFKHAGLLDIDMDRDREPED